MSKVCSYLKEWQSQGIPSSYQKPILEFNSREKCLLITKSVTQLSNHSHIVPKPPPPHILYDGLGHSLHTQQGHGLHTEKSHRLQGEDAINTGQDASCEGKSYKKRGLVSHEEVCLSEKREEG